MSSPVNKSNVRSRILMILIFLVIGWYVFLCSRHYLNQRPPWNDEIAVFESVSAYAGMDFFRKPLKAFQVFPRSYLFLIQKLSEPFDYHLLALRLFPFVFMISAFLVWLHIARYEFRSPVAYLTFVLSWAASVKMIYYAAELKQYSMDVLAAAMFIWFLYNQQRLRHTRLYHALLGGLPFLGMMSYVVFLFIPLVLYNLILLLGEDPKDKKSLGVFLTACSLFGMLIYPFDIAVTDRTTVTKVIPGYFISTESIYEFFNTLGNGTRNLFVRWFAETPRVIRKVATFFTAFGFLYMFYAFAKNIKKDRYKLVSLHTIALVLFIELCIVGAMKKYPFTMPRTSLFYGPVVFFLTIKGIYGLKAVNKYLYGTVHLAYIIFLCVISYGIADYVLAGDLGGMPDLFHRS